jgi:hypothetical protein
MSTPAFELPEVELPFTVASLDPQAQDPGQVLHDDAGFLVYPAAGTDQPPVFVANMFGEYEWDAALTSALINLVPFVGEAKSLVEAVIGKDLITGEHLEWWERLLNVAAALPVVHEASGVLKVVGEVGHYSHATNIVVHTHHAFHVHDHDAEHHESEN